MTDGQVAVVDYRFYVLNAAGHVHLPPIVQELPDDKAAIDNAAIMGANDSGRAIEVWQGARLVHRHEAAPAVEPHKR